MAMQAIEVKFLGATDAQGSRLKAICRAGSITVGWDYALDDDNYPLAAKKLLEKLNWTHFDLSHGILANGNHVFILI